MGTSRRREPFPIQNSYKWDFKHKNIYRNRISDPAAKYLQNSLLCDIADQEISSDKVVKKFKTLIQQAASDLFTLKKSKRTCIFPVNSWFDDDCKRAKSRLRKYKFHEVGSDGYKQFWKMKKSYKALLQKKKRLYQIKFAVDVETLSLKTPQEYWQFWRKNKQKQYTSALECLDTEKFKDFYMRQNETVRNPNFDYVLMEKIETLINSNVDMFSLPQDTPLCDILNSPISGDEVALALRKGKNNKAAGIDGIPVEFYRYGGDELQSTLLVLFNYLFEKGCYPEEWCEGIINPIHKIEDKINPENYRKVTVTPVNYMKPF